MTYTLTRYGEEQLETLPRRIDALWEALPKVSTPQEGQRIVRSSTFMRLNKRLFLLERIRRGEHPIVGSYDFLSVERRARPHRAMQKELTWLIENNLVREA